MKMKISQTDFITKEITHLKPQSKNPSGILASNKSSAAQRMEIITQMHRDQDFEGLDSFVNQKNKEERAKLSSALAAVSRTKTGVSFYAGAGAKAVEQMKQVYRLLSDNLLVYRKLGAQMPSSIYLEKMSANRLGHFSEWAKEIHLNSELFSAKSKLPQNNEQGQLGTFFHEFTHSRHYTENTSKYYQVKELGFEILLPKKAQTTMSEFKEKYAKNYELLKSLGWHKNKTIFDTNLTYDQSKRYNMLYITKDIQSFIYFISRKDMPRELKKEFPTKLIKKLQTTKKYYQRINDIIRAEGFSDYAFCNPLETVAIAGSKEFLGIPLSDKMRQLLKKLGAPKTIHMSYIKQKSTKKPTQ